jgi:hypothetical protein
VPHRWRPEEWTNLFVEPVVGSLDSMVSPVPVESGALVAAFGSELP